MSEELGDIKDKRLICNGAVSEYKEAKKKRQQAIGNVDAFRKIHITAVEARDMVIEAYNNALKGIVSIDASRAERIAIIVQHFIDNINGYKDAFQNQIIASQNRAIASRNRDIAGETRANEARLRDSDMIHFQAYATRDTFLEERDIALRARDTALLECDAILDANTMLFIERCSMLLKIKELQQHTTSVAQIEH